MQLSSLVGHVQEILGQILGSSRPADSLIDQFFRTRKYLGSHDRRFIAETTYGTLRHLRRCEWKVDHALRGWSDELFPEDKVLLTISAFHISQERTPPLTAETLAPRVKSSRLNDELPSILERLALRVDNDINDPAARIGLQYSFPDWMIARFMQEYGPDETEQICAALNQQAPITLRVNTLHQDRDACAATLAAQGVETHPTALSPVGLNATKRMNVFAVPAFKEGFFEVQDEGSQLLALLVDPKPTAKLLDACAGAGGKSLAFSAIMKNRGEIHAADVSQHRLEELKKRSRRACASNIRIHAVDDIEELQGSFASHFDIVFVDAPCTGLGTIRRNPGMKWSVTEQTVAEVSEKQMHILQACAALVKPGGRLVYATCTLLRQENEEVVEEFLRQHADYQAQLPHLTATRLGIQSALGDQGLKLLPHRHGTDGFFCAVLQKAPSPN